MARKKRVALRKLTLHITLDDEQALASMAATIEREPAWVLGKLCHLAVGTVDLSAEVRRWLRGDTGWDAGLKDDEPVLFEGQSPDPPVVRVSKRKTVAEAPPSPESQTAAPAAETSARSPSTNRRPPQRALRLAHPSPRCLPACPCPTPSSAAAPGARPRRDTSTASSLASLLDVQPVAFGAMPTGEPAHDCLAVPVDDLHPPHLRYVVPGGHGIPPTPAAVMSSAIAAAASRMMATVQPADGSFMRCLRIPPLDPRLGRAAIRRFGLGVQPGEDCGNILIRRWRF